MAEVAILSTVTKLGDLLIQKVGFLHGVEEQVTWMKDELQRMQCFLKDAAEKQANDERIRNWISDIRDVTQDADDVIETFILKVDTPKSTGGLLSRCRYLPNHLYHLNKVGKEIETIRARLEDIERSRDRFGIRNLGEGMVLPSGRLEDVEWRRRLAHWQKDKHVVGLKEDVELLLGKAVFDERKDLSVATIVGMGGSGKSTLARIVYNHGDVAAGFDRRAWVCVSSDFRPKEIIKQLVLQLLEPAEDKLKVVETMEKLEVPSLQQMLHQRLQGKRYFIVLDDVWEDAHWEFLASAFPHEDKTSRLLLTSRSRDIASCAQYVHEMKTLDPNQSWELFLNKAFIDNNDGKCPKELESIGREILRKCNGLPLAITVVGGLLAKQRQSKTGWEKVLKEMNSHLGRSGSSVSATLELSYHNLPPQLKSCFLCLGFFKEDAAIRAEKLVQVWIAEGLIPEGGGEETMEDIARSYLDELINRNLVQVNDMSKDDRVKTCHVHDLLRELSIRKAKEEISFEILTEEANSQSLNKPRHRAVYYNRERVMVYSKNQNKHLRSVFFYGTGDFAGTPSYWTSFELLRVLDFEDFGLRVLPDAIGGLIGLRYLGLRNNWIRELPSSLGLLINLEVLDIALNHYVKVPNVIWKMDSLRHLYMSKKIQSDTPLKFDTLKNLQTLTVIPVAQWTPDHPAQMTSLRKLGICLKEDSDVTKLCASLAMLENLVCLNLRKNGFFGRLPRSLDGLGVLHRVTQLKLQGKMTTLPSANNSPPNLTRLTLVRTKLDQDPMPVLEKLPVIVPQIG
ncbi:hypothetical protein DH2020_029946 [Rehmannia glutinosa]|uniref:Uncharacterized protein n=1 Tax=Rehmannia glutinosa TaxID=99300 RepID=A0ABR0VM55_REHGL